MELGGVTKQTKQMFVSGAPPGTSSLMEPTIFVFTALRKKTQEDQVTNGFVHNRHFFLFESMKNC